METLLDSALYLLNVLENLQWQLAAKKSPTCRSK